MDDDRGTPQVDRTNQVTDSVDSQLSLVLGGPENATMVRAPLPPLGPNDLRVRSILSTFKHGTEMSNYFRRSPFASKRFNHDLRIFLTVPQDQAAAFPQPLGNMVVGEVEDAGSAVHRFKTGQLVFGWVPIADRHVTAAERFRPLENLAPEQALIVDPASFALGAVLDGAVTPTDTVLVTGLGAIGLIVIQYCHSVGARVIASSSFGMRQSLALQYGAEHVYDSGKEQDLGLAVKKDFGGVDIAIECSGSNATLHSAIRATRQCGRVVCVGFYSAADSRLHLGEEFLHNRITLLASLPAFSWNNPVRGSEPLLYCKNLQDQVITDLHNGVITPEGLCAPRLPFSDAVDAVKLIADHPEEVVKVLLDHNGGVP